MKNNLKIFGCWIITAATIVSGMLVLQTYTQGSSMINQSLWYLLIAPNKSRLTPVADAATINNEDKTITILPNAYSSNTYSVDGHIRGLKFTKTGTYNMVDQDTHIKIGDVEIGDDHTIKRVSFKLSYFKGMTPEIYEVSK